MKDLVFYRCSICGNLAYMMADSGMVPQCCGQEMIRLIPRTEDTAWEKHLPMISADGRNISVTVGQQPHPMTQEHHIQRIIIATDRGVYIRELAPNEAPEFALELPPYELLCSVYEFCNLHGLWRTDVAERCRPNGRSCSN